MRCETLHLGRNVPGEPGHFGVGLSLRRSRGMAAANGGKDAYIRDLACCNGRLAGARFRLRGECHDGHPATSRRVLLPGREGRLCRTGILLPEGLDLAVRSPLRLR